MSSIIFRVEDPDEGVLVELHDSSGKIRDLSVNADNTIDESENATEIRVSPAPGFTIDEFTKPGAVMNRNSYRYVRVSFTDEGSYWAGELTNDLYFDPTPTFTASATTSGAPVSEPVLPLTMVGDADVVTAELYDDAGELIRALDLNTPLTLDEPTPTEIRVSVASGWLLDTFSATPGKIYSQDDMRYYSLSFSNQGEYYAAEVVSGLYADTEFEVQIGVIEEPGALVSPFNRIYFLNPENLENLAMSVPDFVQDQNYIINLMEVPFKIPDEVKQSPGAVEIGPVKLTIEAPPLDTDVIEFDLGEIDVGELQGTSMDYQGYEFELVVPYSEARVDLDPSYVVGRVLHPVMSVDMYRGDAVINVFVVGVDEPVATTSVKLGRDIPINLGKEMWTSLGSFKGDGNGVPYAYLEVSRSVLTRSRTRVEGVIQGSVGYVEVESVDLVGVLDDAEVRQILAGGVYIR